MNDSRSGMRCVALCKPVQVGCSQDVGQFRGLLAWRNQLGHVVHHLSGRHPAVCHPKTQSSQSQLITSRVWTVELVLESMWQSPSSRTSWRLLMALVVSPSRVYSSFMRGYTPCRDFTSNSVWKCDTMQLRVCRVGLLSTWDTTGNNLGLIKD